MNKIALLFLIFPLSSFGQITITSLQNGNATNPLTWDCTCFPTTDDHIIINHAVTMDVDWAITAAGSITVNSGGSLLQSGLHQILVDGVGSQYLNYGSSAFYDIAFTNGGGGNNTGNFLITRAVYVGPPSALTNSGIMHGIDSLLVEGSMNNSGTCYAGNILNTGTFTQSGQIVADSVGNMGTFNSTGGYMYFNAFGNTGTFNMTGTGFMDVLYNWANVGDFTLDLGLEIFAHNDFYNGDSLGGSANLHNNGKIEVANNFLNGYFIDGSGSFCITNDTYNVGVMNGIFDFCDNTGGAIDLNTGTIAPGITYCATGCFVGIEENLKSELVIYPNPSSGIFNLNSIESFSNGNVFSLSGKLIERIDIIENKLDLTHLESGTYFVTMYNFNETVNVKIIIQ
jgi:hypothetical protein